jgi:hypothetical protein
MTQSKNRAYVCTYVGNAIVNLQNSSDKVELKLSTYTYCCQRPPKHLYPICHDQAEPANSGLLPFYSTKAVALFPSSRPHVHIYLFEPLRIHVLPSLSVHHLLSLYIRVSVKKVTCLMGILVREQLAKHVSSRSTEV